MEHFADRLVAAIRAKKSAVVVGLDPRLELIPEELRAAAREETSDPLQAAAGALLLFGEEIIDIVHPHVAVIKPQIAFYERYGWQGVAAYEDAIAYAHEKGLLVIGDIKRGDIGSTAEAYADAHLGRFELDGEPVSPFGADAVTVNPYLGSDSVKPFIDVCRKHGKGIFVLVRTSNPSGAELQGLSVDGSPLYAKVAHLVEAWGRPLVGQSGYSSVGAVVGGTCREEAEQIRSLLPKACFLVPGYGAQGATADDVAVCFNADGLGAVVNSSRGIIHAYAGREPSDPARWRDSVEAAVKTMNRELAAAIGRRLGQRNSNGR